jgi:hypothetical protein
MKVPLLKLDSGQAVAAGCMFSFIPRTAPGGHKLSAGEGITRASVMGRNALDAFGEQITGRRMADVAQTKDSDHALALVYHR